MSCDRKISVWSMERSAPQESYSKKFFAGAKAIHYSVNRALKSLVSRIDVEDFK